ncbi:GSU2403 family nucleotidyltransferase fold protein [uncultured Paracoccus sp.]|uniref:nucleotidyltransferase family protein n=1 Tax=uncultured Paracoccus sp. TaxID=189685 RepID=UPI00260714BE|nr:GSU2403 family nucleotidyltransferase fold protein [uncultured Paracoccus sp.]
MIQRHSPIAHAAYHDLLRGLKDEAVSALRGTPTRVERNGRAYWYDSFRVGTDVRKHYIGEDSPELGARLAAHRAARDDAQTRRRNRARLVRLLRAEGFLGLDPTTGSLMAALAGSGVFRLGGTVIGTHAFRLYEGELNLRYDLSQTAQTDDIDIASFERLSLALEDAASPPVQEVLGDFAFAPVPSLQPGKTWRWKQTTGNTLIEFLTPAFDAEEGLRPLPALGVEAQALHHLNYLIAEPIAAALPYRNGVLVQIPRPERFAIHKLIVADRRRKDDRLKAEKDRMQAAFLIDALALDRPEDLAEAYEEALDRGPKWRERIAASLSRMPETAVRLEALAG